MVTKTTIHSQGVELEVLFTNEMGEREILFIPGMGGCASSFARDMDEFSHEFCVSFTPRGREGSSAPDEGYSLDHHAEDILAVARELGVIRPIIIANSQGVLWALRAIEKGLNAKAFLAIDHGPHMVELSDHWFETANHKYSPFHAQALKGLRQEYRPIDLSVAWRSLSCPFLLLKGLKEGSHVSAEDVNYYQNNLKNIEIIELPHSGHGLSNDDEHILWERLKQIL
ncbi:alpha/beta hydrolase family protein [Bacteriovorax sp. BSW11_IV]|uniref:alpha/beta fold hydrolase n=1 Tax=Bacteriovorax sp. BSW11_IV TaxID=1353529 RepID=UPI00038A23BD|nr:alpha/beta hydrolase [Bacteriovorax sp. BSW11_IV]EQC48787.1 alpha/beta hydrolase family protein [Bacteriovorax sp. BSW11_IV]